MPSGWAQSGQLGSRTSKEQGARPSALLTDSGFISQSCHAAGVVTCVFLCFFNPLITETVSGRLWVHGQLPNTMLFT